MEKTSGKKKPAPIVRTYLSYKDCYSMSKALFKGDDLKRLEALLSTKKDLHNKPAGIYCLVDPDGFVSSLWIGLLSAGLDQPVHRTDLSRLVSGYIGETEKNLLVLLKQAEALDGLLFFDEADALFGKRTSVSDSHDRYANQEVSYFIEKISDLKGIILLRTRVKPPRLSRLYKISRALLLFE